MIVVNTNVIGYLFLNSEFTDLAENAFRRDPHLGCSIAMA